MWQKQRTCFMNTYIQQQRSTLETATKAQRSSRSAHRIEGWAGPRAGLDGRKKISPPPEFDPRTVQPVASRYADYAMPAHTLHNSDWMFSVRYLLRPKTRCYTERFFNRLSELQKYELRYARRVGRELRHLFCADALNNCSAVLWFTQRQKVVNAFEKCLPLQAFLT
jgi:hypothetical protein